MNNKKYMIMKKFDSEKIPKKITYRPATRNFWGQGRLVTTMDTHKNFEHFHSFPSSDASDYNE